MESPITNIELIKAPRRGRPRLEEADKKKLWEDKEHVAKYNKLYYQNNKDKHKLCRDCNK